jgi:hypothetical protein
VVAHVPEAQRPQTPKDMLPGAITKLIPVLRAIVPKVTYGNDRRQGVSI